MISIGSILDNRYRILKLIGKGGMGSVFLAENIKLGNRWAIKEIDYTANKGINLLAEPEILKKLNHKSLPRIVDIIKTEKYIYIVEDYFEGNNLKQVLASREICTEKNVVKWAKQLCEILIYLHTLKPNPIIYRDMKPGNIIVDTENNIKLIDFGIAREYKTGQESDTTYIATKDYAAPEQLSKSGQSDERTDIYSLGVTLHHVLTGKSPDEQYYKLLPVRQINKKLSEGIEKIIDKCIQADPARRYRNASFLLEDLINIHKLNKEYRRRKIIRAMLCVISIILLVGGAYTINLGLEQYGVERKQAYINLLAEGVAYFNNRNFAQAEEAFLNALAFDIDGEPKLYLAKMHLQKNENAQAISLIRQAIDAGELSKTSEILHILGLAHFNLGQYSAAIEYFEYAVGTNRDVTAVISEHVEIFRDLAVSYGRTGNFAKSSEILDKLVEADEIDTHVIEYISGEIRREQNDLLGAKELLARVVLAEPSNTRYKNSYADLLIEINRQTPLPESEKKEHYENAILLSSEVLNLDAYNVHAIKNKGYASYNLALIYDKTDEMRANSLFEQALAAFQTLLDLGFADSDDYLNVALIHEKMDNLDTANNMFLKALEISPDSSRANLLYGLFLISKNEYEAAIEFLNNTVELAHSTSDVAIAQNKLDILREKGWE